MLMTAALEDGERRVYVTRFASVVSYFTPAESGEGIDLIIEPGHLTFPSDFERNKKAVRESILDFVSLRLCVLADDVLKLPLKHLEKIADPALPDHYKYARRSKNRSVPGRF